MVGRRRPSKQLEPDKIDEVRTELGYRDLAITSDPLPWMVDRFARVLPEQSEEFGQRWRLAASTVLPFSKALRTGGLTSGRDRARAMDSLRLMIKNTLGTDGRW